MEAFQYYTPTKVIFGKDTHKQVGAVIRSYGFTKVLFHYGSGSIKRTGLYDQIVASLNEAGVAFVELGGVEPNPKISLSRKAAQLCIDEGIEMILAVGGGSVLDSSKSAAAGAANHCDPWEFSSGKRVLEKSLPARSENGMTRKRSTQPFFRLSTPEHFQSPFQFLSSPKPRSIMVPAALAPK